MEEETAAGKAQGKVVGVAVWIKYAMNLLPDRQIKMCGSYLGLIAITY